MPQYKCNNCETVFNKKIEYNKHVKIGCVSVSLDNIKDDKGKLINIFKSCLNILRDNEALTGEKALRNLSYFLILRLIEPYVGKEIDIENYNYNHNIEDFKGNDEDLKIHLSNLFKIARFSNLIKQKDESLPYLLQSLWEDILSQHPKTKGIFLPGKTFDIKNQTTIRKILDKLNSYNMLESEHDILGDAYEEVIKDILTGKTLGQFFTGFIIKKIMINLIDPQLKDDGTIESIADPSMGTGGFIISSIKYLLEKSKQTCIQINWDQVLNEGIYGREIQSDTYQLAMANMLISTGYTSSLLENGDSIRTHIKNNFDIVLSNPPFGIDGLVYEEYNYPEKSKQIPIKSNNAVYLFIQLIIYMLKINGRAAVVCPNGQELYNKNKIPVAIREYLMKTCELKEVIYLPPGIFSNTNVNTSILYFVKKIENPFMTPEQIKQRDDMNKKLKIKILAKDRKLYNFVDEVQTQEVSFYNFDIKSENKNLLITVPINKIVEKSYSLNHQEYVEKEDNRYKLIGEIITKKLGEICHIEIGGTPLREIKEYYENGTNLWVSIRELNNNYICDTKEKINDLGIKNSNVKLLPKDTILFSFKLSIGKMAIAGIPLYTNEAIAGINTKDNNIVINKYIYYYLLLNDFSKLGSGILGNGSLNKQSLNLLEIPVPPLDWQNYVVQQLDDIYEGSIKTLKESIARIKKCNAGYVDALTRNIETKPLGELCNFLNGKNKLATDALDEGEYKFITCSTKGYKFLNTYDFEHEALIINSINGSGKCMVYYAEKYSTTNNNIHFKVKENMCTKYLYYYLLHNINLLENGFQGSNQKKITKDYLESIPIPVPSLERQNMIIKSLDEHNNHIMSSKNSIKRYKEEASNLLKILLEN